MSKSHAGFQLWIMVLSNDIRCPLMDFTHSGRRKHLNQSIWHQHPCHNRSRPVDILFLPSDVHEFDDGNITICVALLPLDWLYYWYSTILLPECTDVQVFLIKCTKIKRDQNKSWGQFETLAAKFCTCITFQSHLLCLGLSKLPSLMNMPSFFLSRFFSLHLTAGSRFLKIALEHFMRDI